jgi:hypothetical protein
MDQKGAQSAVDAAVAAFAVATLRSLLGLA